MARKDIITTREIPGLYYVKNQFRSDLDYFALNLYDLTKAIKADSNTNQDIYEVQFWMKKPTFRKLTKTERKKLNLE
jgi:hypothetical protein